MEQTQKAYIAGATVLLSKMPLDNKVLKATSALDPRGRTHESALSALLKLPKLATNVASKIDRKEYDAEARAYQIDTRLPVTADQPVQKWWMAIQGTGRYPNLCKMALALLTCFHGPLVEGSFNVMSDILTGRGSRMYVETYSAIQTVKYRLRKEKMSHNRPEAAITAFKKKDPVFDHPGKVLVRNMKMAHHSHVVQANQVKEKAQEIQKALQLPKPSGLSKRKAKQCVSAAVKKAKVAHLHGLLERKRGQKSKNTQKRAQRRVDRSEVQGGVEGER